MADTSTTITTASRTYIWRTNTPRLGPSSQWLMVNNIKIGWARLALMQKGHREQFDWCCQLPGLKAELSSGKCDTIEAAQDACFKITQRWFQLADTNRGA